MKINSSEPVLLASIHMSHDSVENPFPFFEFERDVVHLLFFMGQSMGRLGVDRPWPAVAGNGGGVPGGRHAPTGGLSLA